MTIVEVEVDINEVFDKLSRDEKQEFISRHVEYAKTSDLQRAFASRCALDKVADGSISGKEAMDILAKIDHGDKYIYMRNQGYQLVEPQ